MRLITRLGGDARVEVEQSGSLIAQHIEDRMKVFVGHVIDIRGLDGVAMWWIALGVISLQFAVMGALGSSYGVAKRSQGACIYTMIGLVGGTASLVAIFGAAWVRSEGLFQWGHVAPWPPLPLGALLIVLGGLAHAGLLFTRLCSVENFGGNPLDLDFGTKCSTKVTTKPNQAIQLTFDCAAHVFQGFLVALLFPAVEYSFWRVDKSVVVFARVCSIFMVVYPFYNFKKRYIKHGGYFARSSFFSNGVEWTLGFVFGALSGLLCTAAWGAARQRVDLDLRNVGRFPIERTLFASIDSLRIGLGSMFVIMILVATVQTYRTWDIMLDEAGLPRSSKNSTIIMNTVDHGSAMRERLAKFIAENKNQMGADKEKGQTEAAFDQPRGDAKERGSLTGLNGAKKTVGFRT